MTNKFWKELGAACSKDPVGVFTGFLIGVTIMVWVINLILSWTIT